MAGEVWSLPAKVLQVVDGDTLELSYNLGFHIGRTARARLRGVNTAEVFGVDPRTAAAADGKKQSQFTADWCAAGLVGFAGNWPFLVSCYGFDKYGRDLVEVERRKDGAMLRASLVEAFPLTRRE